MGKISVVFLRSVFTIMLLTQPYEDRKMLEIKCQSAFFVAIIVCQIADAIISKTRRNSIITQRME